MSDEQIRPEPVARLMKIYSISYNGKSSKFQNKFDQNRIVDINEIDFQYMQLSIWVIRPTGIGNKVFCLVGQENMPLFLGDIVYNGKDVVSHIEFFIGGRVTVFAQKVVVIDSERSVCQRQTIGQTIGENLKTVCGLFRLSSNRRNGSRWTDNPYLMTLPGSGLAGPAIKG